MGMPRSGGKIGHGFGEQRAIAVFQLILGIQGFHQSLGRRFLEQEMLDQAVVCWYVSLL